MRMMSQASVLAGVLAGMLAMPLSPAHAQADFYKGKTIAIVIGAKTGSLAVAAQVVGRHLGKHIPGNPTVINRQMPGGAHLNATNNIFNVADADGLSILAANPNVAMGQLAKLPNVRFDASKFIWLGSSGPDGSMFAIRASLPFKTFQEMRDSGKEFVAGTTGPGSNAHDMPLLLKEFAGLKIRLVAGYAANSDILLAVEREEVGCLLGARHHHPACGRPRRRAPAGAQPHAGAGLEPPAHRRVARDQRHRPLADGDPRHPAVDRTRLRRAAGHARPSAWRCCAKRWPRR